MARNRTSNSNSLAFSSSWVVVPGSELSTADASLALYQLTFTTAAAEIQVQSRYRLRETSASTSEGEWRVIDQVALADVSVGVNRLAVLPYGDEVRIAVRNTVEDGAVVCEGRTYGAELTSKAMELIVADSVSSDDEAGALTNLATALGLLGDGSPASQLIPDSASVVSLLESLDDDLAAAVTMLGGTPTDIPTDAALVLGAFGGADLTVGPEGTDGDADTAPLVVQVKRLLEDVIPTGGGPFELLATLTNDSTGAILQTSAFTVTDDGAGSVALLDTGGTNAVYVLTTDANGLCESLITDVAGASGVTVRVTIYLKNGNDEVLFSGTESGSVEFGGA